MRPQQSLILSLMLGLAAAAVVPNPTTSSTHQEPATLEVSPAVSAKVLGQSWGPGHNGLKIDNSNTEKRGDGTSAENLENGLDSLKDIFDIPHTTKDVSARGLEEFSNFGFYQPKNDNTDNAKKRDDMNPPSDKPTTDLMLGPNADPNTHSGPPYTINPLSARTPADSWKFGEDWLKNDKREEEKCIEKWNFCDIKAKKDMCCPGLKCHKVTYRRLFGGKCE